MIKKIYIDGLRRRIQLSEKELLDNFETVFKLQKGLDKFIFNGSGNQSTYADCELIYDNKYIKLEAKVFNNTHSNNFYKMFTQILINRNLKCKVISEKKEISYGFIFRKQDVDYVKERLGEILYNDLAQFGRIFKLEYIFIYCDKKTDIEIEDWNEFINTKTNNVKLS